MATVGPANTEQEARTSWTSRYPFEPYAAGQGASLACTTSSSRVALVGTTADAIALQLAVTAPPLPWAE